MKKAFEAPTTSEGLRKRLAERMDASVNCLFQTTLRESIMILKTQIKGNNQNNQMIDRYNDRGSGDERRNLSPIENNNNANRQFSRSNQNQ